MTDIRSSMRVKPEDLLCKVLFVKDEENKEKKEEEDFLFLLVCQKQFIF